MFKVYVNYLTYEKECSLINWGKKFGLIVINSKEVSQPYFLVISKNINKLINRNFSWILRIDNVHVGDFCEENSYETDD